MTWRKKKGFMLMTCLNLSPTLCRHTNRCRHTCKDRNPPVAVSKTRIGRHTLLFPTKRGNYFSLCVLKRERAQGGEERSTIYEKQYYLGCMHVCACTCARACVCVYVCVILLCLTEGVKVITQAKSAPLGKVSCTYREQVRLNKPVFIEMFICLAAPWEPNALRFL